MSAKSPAEQNRFVKAISKASYGAGATNGTGFSWWGFRHALAILDLGTLGASATVDVKFQESDALGSGYVDIAGAAFTQKVKATDDDKVVTAEISLMGPRKKYLRAVATVGTAASVVGVHVLLSNPDRTERVYQAQTASEAIAGPLAASGIEFRLP